MTNSDNIKGDKGEPGKNGIQGPRGIQGNNGPRGYRGIEGEKGLKGDVGQSQIDLQNQWKIIPFFDKVNIFYESIYNFNFFIPFSNIIDNLEENEPNYLAKIESNPKLVQTIGLNFNGCLPEPNGTSYEYNFKNHLNSNKTLIIQGYSDNCNNIKIKKYAVYTIGKSFTVEGKYTYIQVNYQYSNLKKFEFPNNESTDLFYRISIGNFFAIEGPIFENAILDDNNNTLCLLSNLKLSNKKDDNISNIILENGKISANTLNINELKFNKDNIYVNDQILIDSNLLLKGSISNVHTFSIDGNIKINDIFNKDEPTLSLYGTAYIKNNDITKKNTLIVDGNSLFKNSNITNNNPIFTIEGNSLFKGSTIFKKNSESDNNLLINIEGDFKAKNINIESIKSNKSDIIIENNLTVKGVIDAMIGSPSIGNFNNSDIEHTDSIADALHKLLKIVNCIALPPKLINEIRQQSLIGTKYTSINCFNGIKVDNVYSGNNLPKLYIGDKNIKYYSELTDDELDNRDPLSHEESYGKDGTTIKAILTVMNIDNNDDNNSYEIGKHIFSKLPDSQNSMVYNDDSLSIFHMKWHKYKCFDSFVATIDLNMSSNSLLENSNENSYKIYYENNFSNEINIVYPNLPEYFYLDNAYKNALNISGPRDTPIAKINVAGPDGYIGNYVSGVPVMTSSDKFSCIFTVDNAVNLFHPEIIAEIYGDSFDTIYLDASMANPPLIYPTSGEKLTYNNIKIPIKSNYYQDINPGINGTKIYIKAYNSIGESFTKMCMNFDTFNNEVLFRIDTKSLEPSSEIFTSEKFGIENVRSSGYACRISNYFNGENPSFSWFNVEKYENEKSIISTQDLQIIAGKYQYPPNVDYSKYEPSGPNYSNSNLGLLGDPIGIHYYRYATFYLGRIHNKNSITILINNIENFGDDVIIPNFKFYVKVLSSNDNTDTELDNWIDGNSFNDNIQNPDGINYNSALHNTSTVSKRIITFGSVYRTGDIIVRIGIPRTSPKKFGSINLL